MQPLTDEKRQKLCKRLRYIAEGIWWADAIEEAADEIERLAAENKKLVGELEYAWRKIEAETQKL